MCLVKGGIVLLNTYEAIYEDHKIIFLNEEPKIKKARVFIPEIDF